MKATEPIAMMALNRRAEAFESAQNESRAIGSILRSVSYNLTQMPDFRRLSVLTSVIRELQDIVDGDGH